MTKTSRKYLMGAAIFAAFVALPSCEKKHEVKAELKSSEAASVKFDAASRFVVSLNNISDFKPIAAVFASDDDVQARARISGTLVSLNVHEGQNVAQGQVVGVIDEARYGAEIAAGVAGAKTAASNASAASASAMQAPANVAAAQAMATKAAQDYNRTKILFDQGVYAKARLDAVQAQMDAANAQVAAASAASVAASQQAMAARSQIGSAQAQVRVAQAVRAQGRIFAPKGGVVTFVPVTQGAVLMPGEIVAYIAGGNPVLRLLAPEADAKSLKLGMSVSLLDGAGGQIGTTTINKIYPSVENGMVKIDLADDGKGHLVGERVNVAIPVGNRDAMIIPKSYLISRDGYDYILLLRNNQPIEVPVQRGQNVPLANIPDGVEILSGLQVNDIIVKKTN